MGDDNLSGIYLADLKTELTESHQKWKCINCSRKYQYILHRYLKTGIYSVIGLTMGVFTNETHGGIVVALIFGLGSLVLPYILRCCMKFLKI